MSRFRDPSKKSFWILASRSRSAFRTLSQSSGHGLVPSLDDDTPLGECFGSSSLPSQQSQIPSWSRDNGRIKSGCFGQAKLDCVVGESLQKLLCVLFQCSIYFKSHLFRNIWFCCIVNQRQEFKTNSVSCKMCSSRKNIASSYHLSKITLTSQLHRHRAKKESHYKHLSPVRPCHRKDNRNNRRSSIPSVWPVRYPRSIRSGKISLLGLLHPKINAHRSRTNWPALTSNDTLSSLFTTRNYQFYYQKLQNQTDAQEKLPDHDQKGSSNGISIGICGSADSNTIATASKVASLYFVVSNGNAVVEGVVSEPLLVTNSTSLLSKSTKLSVIKN